MTGVLNRVKVAQKTAVKADISREEAEKIIKAAFEVISDALSEKNAVTIVGFGKFSIKKRKGRMGRDPNTGKPLKLPESDSLKFNPSVQLRRRIKGKPKRYTTKGKTHK